MWALGLDGKREGCLQDSCFALTHIASLQDVMSTLITQTASCLSDLPRKIAGVFFLSSHMHTLALRVGGKNNIE